MAFNQSNLRVDGDVGNLHGTTARPRMWDPDPFRVDSVREADVGSIKQQ